MFKGSGVAIVTPFTDNGDVNYEELGRLLEFQIENSTDAIIITGTTGEASTLTYEEHMDVISFAVKTVHGRIPVIAGTGSNSTREAIKQSKMAEEMGADGLLIVTPYYNKPTQRGLKAHFEKISEEVNIPIILYAVPGRTGTHLDPETIYELSKIENIVGLKDATGDLTYTQEVARLCGEDFAIYSGNDDLIVPVLSLGGVGVISVLANCLPKETHDMVYNFLNGEAIEAMRSQVHYKPFIDSLFIETNPIPVKAALGEMGYNTEYLRLPLYTMEEGNRKVLREAMRDINLI